MIRKATIKDIPRLLELFNSDASLTGNDNLKYKENYIKDYVTNPLNRVFVYVEDNKIVGIQLVEFWKIAKYCYLNVLVVDKKYRGKGIGTKLIKHVEKEAKKQGIKLFFFYSEKGDKEMHKLAKKLKYERGKDYYFFSKLK